jgi:hypothetical protein
LNRDLTHSNNESEECQPCLAAYVEQVDTHLPFLTVKETAQFSHDNSTPPPTDPALHADKLHAVGGLYMLLNPVYP